MTAWQRLFALSLALVLLELGLVSTVKAQGGKFNPPPRPAEEQPAADPSVGNGPPPEEVEVRSVGKLKIGFVPFFSAENRFGEDGDEIFDDWLKKAIKSLLEEEAFENVDHEWIRAKQVDSEVFEGLPKSRLRSAAGLLKPLAVKKIEGVIATWVEEKGENYDLVVAFYLPNRIQLEEHRLSANFERSTLIEEPQGGFEEEPTQNLMRELLRRNLNRILPIEAPAHAPATPTPTNDGSKGRDGAEEDENGGAQGEPIFAVLDFSREFSMDEATLKKLFSRSPMTFPFGKTAANLLGESFVPSQIVTPKSSKPVTFDQIEAPVLDLDPNADPNAREKALLARAGGSVNTLVFGHLREERKKKDQPSLWLYVRLLRKGGSQYAYHSAEPREWQAGDEEFHWNEAIVQSILHSALSEALSKAGMGSGVAREDVEHRVLTIRKGHTVFQLAKECYGGQDAGQITEVLGRTNKLKSNDDIRIGNNFILPFHIGRNELRDRKFCR